MLSLLNTVWQVKKSPPYPTDHVCVYNYDFYIYCISKHVAHAVHLVYYIKQTSEKTDGAIQNAQPRDTGNIGYIRQDEDK